MAPNCPCKRIRSAYGQTFYLCKKNGVEKVLTVQTTNINVADGLICDVYENTNFPIVSGCLPYSTPVLMADGSSRPLIEVEPGDTVIACAIGSHKIEKKEVTQLNFHTAEAIVELGNSSGEVISCSISQHIMTTYGPVEALHIQEGANVLSLDGSHNRLVTDDFVVSHKKASLAEIEVASLNISDDYYFFVGENRRAVRCKGHLDHDNPKSPDGIIM